MKFSELVAICEEYARLGTAIQEQVAALARGSEDPDEYASGAREYIREFLSSASGVVDAAELAEAYELLDKFTFFDEMGGTNWAMELRDVGDATGFANGAYTFGNVYAGEFEAGEATVTVNGEPLDARLDLCNHSPTGFAWGYGGSGPAQLALAILAHEFGDEFALAHYMDFKWAIIAWMLPCRGWRIDEGELREMVKAMDGVTWTFQDGKWGKRKAVGR